MKQHHLKLKPNFFLGVVQNNFFLATTPSNTLKPPENAKQKFRQRDASVRLSLTHRVSIWWNSENCVFRVFQTILDEGLAEKNWHASLSRIFCFVLVLYWFWGCFETTLFRKSSVKWLSAQALPTVVLLHFRAARDRQVTMRDKQLTHAVREWEENKKDLESTQERLASVRALIGTLEQQATVLEKDLKFAQSALSGEVEETCTPTPALTPNESNAEVPELSAGGGGAHTPQGEGMDEQGVEGVSANGGCREEGGVGPGGRKRKADVLGDDESRSRDAHEHLDADDGAASDTASSAVSGVIGEVGDKEVCRARDDASSEKNTKMKSTNGCGDARACELAKCGMSEDTSPSTPATRPRRDLAGQRQR